MGSLSSHRLLQATSSNTNTVYLGGTMKWTYREFSCSAHWWGPLETPTWAAKIHKILKTLSRCLCLWASFSPSAWQCWTHIHKTMRTIRELPKPLKKRLPKLPRLPRGLTEARTWRSWFCTTRRVLLGSRLRHLWAFNLILRISQQLLASLRTLKSLFNSSKIREGGDKRWQSWLWSCPKKKWSLW